MTDHELLESYRSERSEPAFTTLVQRHIDAVYSAALRQVGSPDLAKELSHAVFNQLAASANGLGRDTHVASWLHTMTCRHATEIMQRERQRARREAAGQKTDSPVDSTWRAIRAMIDEALAKLPARDREAAIRRYFESQSFREIGAALGIPEDAAQKRVSRALDELRAHFAKRSVTTSGTALASALSTHAVETAPFGLGVLVGTSAARAKPSARAAVARVVSAPVARNVSLAAAVLAVGLCLWLSVVRRAQAAGVANARTELARLEARRDAARRQPAPAALPTRIIPSQPDAADPVDARARVLARRIQRLQDYFVRVPEDRSPQMSLLSAVDWIVVADASGDLDDERLEDTSQFGQANAFIQAVCSLDQIASQRFRPLLSAAARAYRKATGRSAITDVRELAPFLSPAEATFLRGYSIVPAPRSAPVNTPPVLHYQRFGASWDLQLDP
jgi:RNA polymerase sigma factor (sigma-70 family)